MKKERRYRFNSRKELQTRNDPRLVTLKVKTVVLERCIQGLPHKPVPDLPNSYSKNLNQFSKYGLIS